LDVSILFTDLVACTGLAFAGVAVNCLVGFALGAPALILCWAARRRCACCRNCARSTGSRR
jgi:hypothetical protein